MYLSVVFDATQVLMTDKLRLQLQSGREEPLGIDVLNMSLQLQTELG